MTNLAGQSSAYVKKLNLFIPSQTAAVGNRENLCSDGVMLQI